MKVAVIGAGVAGLAIGWRLAQAGQQVVVLDRTRPARGATWAAAGMIAAAAEAGDKATPEAELAYRARARWADFAREIEDASGMSVGYAQDGALMIASTQDEAAHNTTRARANDELALLSRDDARALVPLLSGDILSALWAPKEARVDNRALGDALAVAFTRAGGTLVPNEAVLRIETRAGRATGLRTSLGLHEADAFVLAAGAWSGSIDGIPRDAIPPVKPMKGEMLALAPPAGISPPVHVVWGNGVYLVPRGGRLLIGATLEDAGFDMTLTDAAAQRLFSRAVSVMPALAAWKVTEHWAGLRPASPDGLPILGRSVVDGLFIATGQHRNGILFAPLVAEILSRSVLERSSDRNAFDPRRFPGSLAPSSGVR